MPLPKRSLLDIAPLLLLDDAKEIVRVAELRKRLTHRGTQPACSSITRRLELMQEQRRVSRMKLPPVSGGHSFGWAISREVSDDELRYFLRSSHRFMLTAVALQVPLLLEPASTRLRKESRDTFEDAKLLAACLPTQKEGEHPTTLHVPKTGGVPVYQHNCSNCVFIEHHCGCDLYYCPTSKDPKVAGTVIARRSSKSDHYSAGNMYSYNHRIPILHTARLYAENLGIKVPEELM
jgi:hypothetical protein